MLMRRSRSVLLDRFTTRSRGGSGFRTDLGERCAWCGGPVEGRRFRIDGRTCCSRGCADRLRCQDAWLPGVGDGDVDPTGSTPPRRIVQVGQEEDKS